MFLEFLHLWYIYFLRYHTTSHCQDVIRLKCVRRICLRYISWMSAKSLNQGSGLKSQIVHIFTLLENYNSRRLFTNKYDGG